MTKKTVVKIDSYRDYRSNAVIFGIDKNGEQYRFLIDYDYLSIRARSERGDTLKRAAIKRMRERYTNFKFIVPTRLNK